MLLKVHLWTNGSGCPWARCIRRSLSFKLQKKGNKLEFKAARTIPARRDNLLVPLAGFLRKGIQLKVCSLKLLALHFPQPESEASSESSSASGAPINCSFALTAAFNEILIRQFNYARCNLISNLVTFRSIRVRLSLSLSLSLSGQPEAHNLLCIRF